MKINKCTIFFICILIFLDISDVVSQTINTSGITVSTKFTSGGGTINVISSTPAIVRFMPHDEGQKGWSRMWWYFKVEGLNPGEEIILQLEQNDPPNGGVDSRVNFSYDQEIWGLTNSGVPEVIDGKNFFVYRHKVRGEKIWFAYDLPYTPDLIQKYLISEANRNTGRVKVFELCKTKNNRPVMALNFNGTGNNSVKKYNIWLQARTHAFETGGSWVLHELTRWLLSGDPSANALLNCASITVIPIVDVDGVVEGRTGKNQVPYDHNRKWDNETDYWVEIKTIKSMLNNLARQNKVDFFLDFHGPGGNSHPFFIVPFENDLKYEKQRKNRSKFFEILNAKPFDAQARLSQSMTHFFFSERPWDPSTMSSSNWATMKTNEHTIALTLEVNMKTPLSTNDGYRAQAITLGKAISTYFSNSYHEK